MMPRLPRLSQSLATILMVTAMLFPPLANALMGEVPPTREDTLTHRLVTEHSTVTPGQKTSLLWAVDLDGKWHIYWKNPGDSGLPPELKIEGAEVGPLAFPTPKRIDIDPVTNYGYGTRVVFKTAVTIPASAKPGPFTLPVTLEYLYCDDICLPGTVTYQLPLNVGDKSEINPAFAELNTEHEASLPQPWPASPLGLTENADGTLSLNFMAFSSIIPSAQFIPADEGLIHDNAPQPLKTNVLTLTKDPQALTQPPLNGLLILNGKGFIMPELKVGTVPGNGEATPVPTPPAPEPGQSGMMDGGVSALLLVLGSAFLAGLILNLMPCVLPVLALKVLGLIKHSSVAQRRSYGLGYTAGVLATFSLFALAIILLQRGGTELGWGFHLQNSWFVAALTTLMVGLALNFWGVFSVGDNLTRLAGKPSHAAPTFANALATGALAVIVATPCTVPFMGTAMAYAFTQPWPFTWLTFMVLGLGLAAPFLLFSLIPSAARLLPKPGAWMVTLKSALGWPLMATALWLAWVFTGQTTPAALFMLLVGLLTFAAMLWWYGKKQNLLRLALTVLTLGAVTYALAPMLAPTPATEDNWKPWSKSAEQTALQTGPVFVDFTADWCITCKVVEATVLNTEPVQAIFKKTGTTIFKADWTKQDDTITRELAAHGRKGVPLYLVYLPGKTAPQILPQLPTKSDIENALNP